ncbi:hypothetical protein [Priestia endophytica]|uniref:hypothetical protein n=1 Tax=Priestia endophytica TaxID=135735 RepID=UPI00228192DF|nr:hypothetical protein [Priestia endophytica]MCY8235538.1 hypothetical protein [Priestia endophytica]
MSLSISKGTLVKLFISVSALMLVFASLLPSLSFAASDNETENMRQLENDLEFIFDEATTMVDNKYVLDEEKTADYFGTENVAAIKIFIKLVNEEPVTETEFYAAGLEPQQEGANVSNEGQISTLSWTGCVKDKILIATGIGFITGGMNKLIEEKAWKKLAMEVLKIAGKNAVKGGVVGLTASLGVWSIACIGK